MENIAEKNKRVKTPVGSCVGRRVSKKIVLIPILRSNFAKPALKSKNAKNGMTKLSMRVIMSYSFPGLCKNSINDSIKVEIISELTDAPFWDGFKSSLQVDST